MGIMVCITAPSFRKTLMEKAFVGTWALKRFELITPKGEALHPLGENPMGIAMIDGSGYLSAQLCQRDRPRFSSASPPLEELQAVFSGYVAYFGRCSIDTDAGTLTTRVQGASNPEWMGEDQLRHYEISGDTMILRTPPQKIKALGDLEVVGKVTWGKVA